MPKATKKTKRRTIETWELKKPDCTNGQIVFGFVHKPWWPGVVITEYVRDMKTVKPNQEWVYWYGDKKISEVEHKKLCCFKKHYRMLAFKGDVKHQEGMQKAIENCALQEGLSEKTSSAEKLEWAEKGFHIPSSAAPSPEAQKSLSSGSQSTMLTADVILEIDNIRSLIDRDRSERVKFSNLQLPITKKVIPGKSSTKEKVVEVDMETSHGDKTEDKTAGVIEEETVVNLSIPEDTETDIPCSTSTPENPLEADMGTFLDKNGVMDIAGEVEVEMHDDLTQPKATAEVATGGKRKRKNRKRI